MEVVAVRTPGSMLAALEIREDFSMVERRVRTLAGGLSLAVASAGSEVLLSDRASPEAEATIILADDTQLLAMVGADFAVGTARFTGVEIDENGLWALPTRHGVIQAGDVVRIIPAPITSTGPFPRTPDGLPDAEGNEEKRFSAPYEARAEQLWHAIADLGCRPSLEWAGSEDGEAMVGRAADDSVLLVIDLEDPAQQRAIDALIDSGELSRWLMDEFASGPDDE